MQQAARGANVEIIAITVSTDDGDRDLVLQFGDRLDADHVADAAGRLAGDNRLVVDRSGTPLRGALLGRDLLNGDRIVPVESRTQPLVAAITGPLHGASATVDTDLRLGRGGSLGTHTIDDPEVSREHLRLSPTPGAVRVVDPGSMNGTFVNGSRVEGSGDLHPGDRLALGQSTLVLFGDPPRGRHLDFHGGSVTLKPTRDHQPIDDDLAETTGAIAGLSPSLWRRTSKALPVRIGLRPPTDGTDSYVAHPAEPVEVDLASVSSVSLRGSDEQIGELLAAWFVTVAATHGPLDLRLGLLLHGDSAPPLRAVADAARWLPQITERTPLGFSAPWWRRDDAAIHDLLTYLAARAATAPTRGRLVIAVDARSASETQHEQLRDLAPKAGATLVWLVGDGDDATGSEVSVRFTGDERAVVSGGPLSGEVVPHRMSAPLFDRLARHLAPLVPADAERPG